MRFYFSLLLISCAGCLQLHAQQNLNFQNAKPSTPEVASFAKNVDIPMNYSSGLPQIGISFGSVKSSALEVGVSLSYNASGIRVDEGATWVGLGWNLNTGPTLVRTVRGLPDDDTYGYIHSAANRKVKYVSSLPYASSERYQIEAVELSNGQLDLEPDIFSFSALGYSGQFFWSQDSGKFILSPYQNIKIETPFGLNGIASFVITLPNGVKCVFGGDPGCNCHESFQSSTTTSFLDWTILAPVTSGTPYISGWGITSVIEPSGRSIDYTYQKDVAVEEFGRGGEQKGMSLSNQAGTFQASFYKNVFNKPVLEKISGENCDIVFKRSSAVREDVLSAGRSLDTIQIRAKTGEELKSYLLKYKYTVSPDSIILYGLEACEQTARKRLVLSSVTEKNIATNLSLPPYEFTYSSTALPSRLSTAQDYWGYYNGKNNGKFLMPRIPLKTRIPGLPNDELPRGFIAGADRRIDPLFSQAGLLTAIRYPTGGVTRYSYETNETLVNMYFNDDAGIERPDAVDRTFTFMPLLPADAPYPHYFQDTFRISGPVTQVKISPNLPAPCDSFTANASCLYTIKIKSLPDSATSIEIHTTLPLYASLPSSLYKIEAFVSGSSNEPVENFRVDLQWSEAPDPMKMKVGGVRVKKIVSVDEAGNSISRSFDYNWPGSLTETSGMLMGLPTHIANEYDTLGNVLRFHFVSNSTIPLTTDGQTVRYQFVTEYLDSVGSSFKNEYSYLGDIPNVSFGAADDAPLTTKGWMNNLLLRRRSFEKTSTGYRELTDQWNNYTSFQSVETLYGLHGSQLRKYYVASEWYLPTSEESNTYSYQDDQQIAISSTTAHYYNQKFFPALSRTTNSRGQVVDSRTWYPDDYDNVSGYNLDLLKANFIVNIPVKQEVSVSGKIRSGSIFKYSGLGLPEQVYSYESSVLTDTVVHSRNVVVEPGYQLKSDIRYDINNNLRQINPKDNVTSAYIWDYATSGFTGLPMLMNPIAVVQNADTNSVAYTSFENTVLGGWQIISGSVLEGAASITGKKYFTGTLRRSGLPAGNYVVSLWCSSGSTVTVNGTGGTVAVVNGSRKLLQWKLPGVTSVDVTGSFIDEVRLHPAGAEMTSYTFTPFLSIASVSDANNRITFYEYDKLERLALLRDWNGHIIKKVCYNYFGQPEDCGLNEQPLWQPTDSTRCKPCAVNPNYKSKQREKEEADINRESSSYKGRRWVDDGAGDCEIAVWQNTATAVRCKTVNGGFTGEQEQEQIDLNPCSDTYNQVQWTVVSTDCTICPKPPVYDTTYVCVTDANGNNTGERLRIMKDVEPCSLSFLEVDTVSLGANTSECPTDGVCPADWQEQSRVCELDGSGANTGREIVTLQDVSSCSATAGQTTVTYVNNCTSCPKPANLQTTYECVKDGNNKNTGSRKITVTDTEPCSATAGVSTVSYETNCSTCPVDPNLQTTYECVKDENNKNTGSKKVTVTDIETCSATAGVSTVTYESDCSTCPKDAVYQTTYECVKDASGNNTGERIQIVTDIEPCSATYLSETRTSLGTDYNSCPLNVCPANWTEESRTCELNGQGQNTGRVVITERDDAVCSQSYNTTRVRYEDDCTNCPKLQNWLWTDNYSCGGSNTKYREQVNIEACSPGYNTTRWIYWTTVSANWQPVSSVCEQSGGANTGNLIITERDIEPCSSTYNQTRQRVVQDCISCPTPPSWQPTGNLRCVPDGTGYYTGEQQREERDVAACSPTYNNTRWVFHTINCSSCPQAPSWMTISTVCEKNESGRNTGNKIITKQDVNSCSASYNQTSQTIIQDCSICPKDPIWTPTGNTRCVQSGGVNTGEQEREERDLETCSPSYNQIRWENVGINCQSCPTPPDWQPTGLFRCVQSGGVNTGEQEWEERDQSQCSPTYNQTRWVNVGINCQTCTTLPNWIPTGNTRCVQSGGVNTGEQEREERDQSQCSPTYNQIRWLSNGINCTVCPKPPNWTATGGTRCVQSGGANTGEQEREERDTEPCSTTYNNTRWVSNGTNCTSCPKPANWQPTGNSRCLTAHGVNTGYQEIEQIDVEPCSDSFNVVKWVDNGYQTAACPLPASCTTENCAGVDMKCMGNYCETGIKVYTASVWNSDFQMYECTYHYEFSDNSWSKSFKEFSSTDCPIVIGGS